MFWVAAGLVILGAACGAAFRLLFLIGVLLVATAIVVVGDIARGSPNVLMDAIIAIVLLQVGYALGIGLRAFHYARMRRKEAAAKTGPAPYSSIGSRREGP